MYSRGYSIVALALHVGASHTVAFAVGVAAAVVIAFATVYYARRGDQVSALALALALSLLATPVLWMHYFALLLVPMALARPRLDVFWFLPLALWICPVNPRTWQAIVALVVNSALVGATIWRGRPRHADAAGDGTADAEPCQPRGTPVLAFK
jgi:hypothetical protein